MAQGTLYKVEIEGAGADFHVVQFEGWESISGLFEFRLTLLSEDGTLTLNDFLGKKAHFTIHDARHVHGIVVDAAHGDQAKKLTAYAITLAPAVARLTFGIDSRIFQDKTSIEIAKAVFEAAGLPQTDYRLDVQGTPKKREYCVQYRESSWAFVSRIFEEDGIYTYFEHSEEGSVLVASDTSTASPPIVKDTGPTIRFRGGELGALHKEEHVMRFHVTEGMRPGKVTLRDYNFKKPALNLEAAETDSAWQALEVYEFPGAYDDPDTGSAIAKLRLERWNAARKIAQGASTSPRLAVGHFFRLAEHYREDANIDWVVTHVEHRGFEPTLSDAYGSGEPTYQNTFRCIPASVKYRPPLTTPKPTIRGIQTAIVTGPAGEEIHTDEYGRIKVQFHWDRQGAKDDKSSCWIRVAQGWAGAGWGMMHIPRVGHEVVVEFLEGDPDRPLVTGRVYHGTNVPPYTLPSEKTKSTIKSSSSPGSQGFNELRFEDKKGNEEIFLHGQKDWTIAIENDKNQKIGHDESLDVVRHRSKHVGGDQKEAVDGNDTITVKGDRTETIEGAETVSIIKDAARSVGGAQSVTIAKAATVEIGDKLEASIGADQVLTVSGAQAINVSKDQSESVGKDKKTEVSGGFTITVQKDLTSHTTGNHAEEVGKNRTFVVGEKLSIECGNAKVTIQKNGNVTVEGKNVTIKGSGPVKIEGQKLDVKANGAVNLEASGAVKVRGSAVGVN